MPCKSMARISSEPSARPEAVFFIQLKMLSITFFPKFIAIPWLHDSGCKVDIVRKPNLLPLPFS